MPLPTIENKASDLVVVSSYTRFDNLAHGPRGTEGKYAMYSYRLDPNDGQLLLLSVDQEPAMNPAFSRYNPAKNMLYACTESVAENGQVITWKVDHNTGKLERQGTIDAGGTSTCYITIDREKQNLLVVNYWDATLKVMSLDENGVPKETVGSYDPKEGKQMQARADKHVNHSRNDAEAQKERQADPHSHAIVLDPIFGRIAFVPDLGKDVIRQFCYDPAKGSLQPIGHFPSGTTGRPGIGLGPRYIDFHPTLPVAYVINELSCEVSVFEFLEDAARLCIDGRGPSPKTLKLIQNISTVPDGFPIDMNTCGRIAVHNSGAFVLAANRGHDSVAVFRVRMDTEPAGQLALVDITHVRGRTPRHFKFDTSGQWLIAANQDTDRVDVFHFNIATGKLTWTGHHYNVPSPNFVETMRGKNSGQDSNKRARTGDGPADGASDSAGASA
eukprot:TRINITY_DN54301_c0_g1_i1.p1 TRINITY_DN54301_c0_g1~~TRINITY_DN54301_c0_g1_i1.p1  ORF type:complete len:471 (-),score=75.32 TRINITY_DN54301_c0_g1_i1:128-1456(-)